MHRHHPLFGREMAAHKAMPLVVRAVPDNARFSLRIDPAEIAAASQAFGLKLPASIGRISTSGDRCAVCLGPDEWYLIAPLAEQDALAAAFADMYDRSAHSLVDIGHREVGIEVQGDDAVLALQSAIAFDVGAMPAGTGCRTLFDKAQIVLLRETEHRFRIEVWRSFADHVWGLLEAVGREIDLAM